MSFIDFKLHDRLLFNIRSVGYETPTPIQEQSIPKVMEGHDLMGLAQTGTGKTAAFLLPALHRMMTAQTDPRDRRPHVRLLVIAPTRELAQQIFDSARELGAGTGLRGAVIYGGVGMQPQIRAMRQGVDVVVACPGRLLDLMNQGVVDLSRVETLVLDEADHMFDMGFLPSIRRILAALSASRQTLLFSATMPQEIRQLAHDILRNPVTVSIGRVAPASTVEQSLYPCDHGCKTGLLMELLRRRDDGKSVLIFTRTKHRAKRLSAHIEKEGFPAASLQGNLSQSQRQAALDGFRDGRVKILVATDIAARGIDVSRVGFVVNYDIPDTAEAYAHRIGRTGRAERTGEACTLATREDARIVRAIESMLGKRLPRHTLEGFDYRVTTNLAPLDDREERPAPRFGRQPGRPQQNGRPGAPTGQARRPAYRETRGAAGGQRG